MSLSDGALLHWSSVLMIAIVLFVVVDTIVVRVIDTIKQRLAAKRQPPTTDQPRPGITDARICPTTEDACRRDCAGRCWHQE